MISFVEAQKAGLFNRDQLLPNLMAGIITGVVALPLAMAFAIASGARPEQGIYTAIVAGLLVSVMGGSRVQIAGPTGAFIVVLSGITARYGIGGLQLATLMAGVMLLLMGIARLGSVIKFIPAPVIVGFTTGIGVIIWVGQWEYFFGLPAAQGRHFHEKFWHLLQSLPQVHWATMGIATMSLLLVIFSAKIPAIKRIPGPMIALVAATMMQSIFHFHGVATIGSAFGGIPQHLPAFALPSITISGIIELMGPAFTIAMLGAIESLLSAVVADGLTNTRHDSNQELIGQGLANMAAPLFGGFAATGAIARTATSIRHGGSSPLAGITHAIMLLLTVLFLAPLAVDVPLAALAAILFVVAYNMSDIKHFIHMARCAPRADVAILLITFGLTVFVDLVVAVNIGVVLAILQFLRRMAAAVTVQHLTQEDLAHELSHHGWQQLPPDTSVYAIEGPLFFGAVDNFERALMQPDALSHKIILRLRQVPFVDITGLQSLEDVIRQMQTRGTHVMMCEANERVKTKMRHTGLINTQKPGDYFDDFVAALAHAAKAETTASHIPTQSNS